MGRSYRQQVDQVLVGVQPRGDLLQLDQLVDVAVQSLQLLDVHLVVLHVIRHGLVDRDQVFEVDPEDGDFETRTPVVSLSIVVIVPAGGQQVRHLVQYLGSEKKPFTLEKSEDDLVVLFGSLRRGIVYLGDLTGHMRGGVL